MTISCEFFTVKAAFNLHSPVTTRLRSCVNFPGKSFTKEMPAISVSNSLHFPANLLEKLETQFFRKSCLWFKSNQNLPLVLLFKEKKSFISVLAKGTFKKNQECIVDLKSRKGWIHFVGVGGCGLSALAVLALKQVSSFCKTLTLIFCLVAENVKENETKCKFEVKQDFSEA